MSRVNTLARIRAEMGLTSVVKDIVPGISAIDPDRMQSVRDMYADQTHFLKWLDKGYRTTLFHLGGASNVRCYVVTDADEPSWPSFHNCFLEDGNDFSYTGSSNTSVVGEGYSISLPAPIEYFTGTTQGGSTYIEAQVLSGNFINTRFLGRSFGPRQRMEQNIPSLTGLSASSGLGNLTPHKFMPPIVTLVPTKRDEVLRNWPLLVGPAVVTRGEYYFDDGGPIMSYTAASNGDLADYVETMVPFVTNQTDKANLIRRVGLLRTKRGDVSISADVPQNTNVFKLYPKTSGVAGELWNLRGVQEGNDFTLGHVFWDSTTRPQYGMAGGAADIQAATALAAGMASNVEFKLMPTGLVMETSFSEIVPIDQLAELARSIRLSGRTVTIVQPPATEYDAISITIREPFEKARAAALGPIDSSSVTLLDKNGDNGAVGLALISAGFTPISLSSQQTLASILKGSILDVYME